MRASGAPIWAGSARHRRGNVPSAFAVVIGMPARILRDQALHTTRSARMMPAMRRSVVRLGVILAALTLFGPLQASAPVAPTPVSLAPLDTNLVARVDLTGIQHSPLIEALRSAYHRELGIVETLMGLFVGFVPQDVASAWLFASEPHRGVLLLEGAFSAEDIANKLARFDGLETREVAGVRHVSRMVETRNGRVTVFAVLSDRLLALGDEQAMGRLFAAWRGELKTLPSTEPALQRVAGANGHLSATLRDPASWPELDAQAAELIDQTWLQAQFTDDLRIELDLHAVDALAAEALENIIRGWLLIEQRNPELRSRPTLLNGLESAQLTRQERVVQLAVELTGEQIAQGLASQGAPGRQDPSNAPSVESAPAGP
jgi:hypothetical protein